MRKCGTCFRYIESWKDAEAKGLEPFPAIRPGEYHRKPRPGIKAHAIGIHCPDDDTISADHPACDGHEYRWLWNLRTWWRWHFIDAIKEWYRQYVRVPIGARRKPIALEWKDYFDGMRDEIIPNGEPVCPHCGEYPYTLEQCVFCGQRYLKEGSASV